MMSKRWNVVSDRAMVDALRSCLGLDPLPCESSMRRRRRERAARAGEEHPHFCECSECMNRRAREARC